MYAGADKFERLTLAYNEITQVPSLCQLPALDEFSPIEPDKIRLSQLTFPHSESCPSEPTKILPAQKAISTEPPSSIDSYGLLAVYRRECLWLVFDCLRLSRFEADSGLQRDHSGCEPLPLTVPVSSI